MTEISEQKKPACHAARTVHTIGHSTRSIEALIELLNPHTIELLIDVRRWPGSKRHPQFNRDALSVSLKAKRIEYLWRGDLGGFRKPTIDSPNIAWRVSAFRAYADFMLTDEFERIMKEVETIADEKRIALMCAEAVPWRCHRQLLADAFIVRGWIVYDIMDDGDHEHMLPAFARVEGTRIYYSGRKESRMED
jgi:uncharacterized protein (DUF488 family)